MAHNAYEYERCRSCGGPLQILDPNRSLNVTCVECADTYDLDPEDDERCVTDHFANTVPKRGDGGAG